MDAWSFLYITNLGLISIIFLVHLRFTKKDHAANRFFSLFLFTLAYTSFMLLLFHTRYILRFPHFARTGNLFLYLIYPSAYLYVRKILKQESWKRTDLLHLAPAFIYLVDFFPYFIKSAEAKIALLELDFASNNIYLIRQSKLFRFNFHFIFRSLLSVIYCFLMIRLWFRTFFDQESLDLRTENRSLMQWTAVLIALLLVGIAPSVVTFLFRIPVDLATLLNTSIYFVTVFFAVFLFFRPEVVYGVRGLLVQQPLPATINGATPAPPQIAEAQVQSSPGRKIYIKQNKVEELGHKIEEVLSSRKPYLESNFSIADLAKATGFPVHQISAYLNIYQDMNFNEYINGYRIRHLLDRINSDNSWQQFNIEGLAQQVGFNNRYTFLNAFKRVTGETPSVFLREKKTRAQ
jgi:AraC-like DNA-binding protein